MNAIYPNSLGIRNYLDFIPSTNNLNSKEEIKLLQLAQTGDEQATLGLMQSHMKYIIKVSKNYKNKGLDLEDLLTEGLLGLRHAIFIFDLNAKVRFISYALWWVKQFMFKAINTHGRLIRLPMNKVSTLMQIRNANEELRKEKDYVNNAMIAEKLNMATKEVDDLLSYNRPISPLEFTGSDDDADYAYDVKDNRYHPTQSYEKKDLKEQLMASVNSLSEKEADVIKGRYGLVDGKKQTLKILADKLSLSIERIRQIENKAINKLKEMPELEDLKDYIS